MPRFVIACLLLVACGGEPEPITESNVKDQLAITLCERIDECVVGQFAAEWDGDHEACQSDRAALLDELFQPFADLCPYSQSGADGFRDDLMEATCGDIFRELWRDDLESVYSCTG